MARHDHTRRGERTEARTGARDPARARGRAARDSVDLDRLSLKPGEAHRLEFEITPGELELAGSDYGLAGEATHARLDISRTVAGFAFRLRFAGAVSGPCMRCLEHASAPIEVDAREVDQPSSGDEELLSPYVSDARLDIGRWAHDAFALALPHRVLCRPDCAGLCPVCGGSLNDAEADAHDHERAPDPRWAKLRELQE